jgi:hypothetical protein
MLNQESGSMSDVFFFNSPYLGQGKKAHGMRLCAAAILNRPSNLEDTLHEGDSPLQ